MKWALKKRNFSVNDIVIVKNDNQQRCEWPLARITKVFPSEDGMVRSVQLVTSGQDDRSKQIELTRPITKLVLLVEAESCSIPQRGSLWKIKVRAPWGEPDEMAIKYFLFMLVKHFCVYKGNWFDTRLWSLSLRWLSLLGMHYWYVIIQFNCLLYRVL